MFAFIRRSRQLHLLIDIEIELFHTPEEHLFL